MNAWRRNSEVVLDIGVLWGSGVDFGIGVDEGQVLSLSFGEHWDVVCGDRHSRCAVIDCPGDQAGDRDEHKIHCGVEQ